MALADIVQRTRAILYGTGLGEKPALRLAPADAAEDSTSDPIISFDLASGEGAKVAAGDILSVYDADDETKAFVFYVTDVATDTITSYSGYNGAPGTVVAADLDLAVFEHNPFVTGFEIFEAVDTILANYLYPEVYKIVTDTVASPDLIDGQEAVPAVAQEILSAHQIIGPSAVPIGFSVPEPVHSTLASTGRLACFDWFDGSAGYFTYKAKYTESDVDDDLLRMVATGAAALALGGHLVEVSLASTKQDNPPALNQRQAVASLLWRDFLTMKQGKQEELARDGTNNFILIDRG